jgi:hypothetical protein
MTHVNVVLVWLFVFAGVAIAFLLEWRYARRFTCWLCALSAVGKICGLRKAQHQIAFLA